MENNKKKGIKKYIKAMGNAVSVLSILFVLSALLRTDFHKNMIKDTRLFFGVCLAGVAFKALTVFLSGNAWRLWLEFFSQSRCDRREALRVYAKANIGKYLPGNVMHYLERNLFAGKLGLSQKQVAAASMTEVFCLVLAAFLTGICLAHAKMLDAVELVAMQLSANRTLLFAGIALGAFAVAAVGLGLYFYHKRAGIVARKRHVQEKRNWKRFVRVFVACFATYISVLLILGLILVLLYWYWAGRPDRYLAMLIVAAYIIAWVLGFVVPGAPGGIGVRELVLTLLLSSAIGTDTVVALSVLHRLITVLGDFAAYFLRRLL